MSRAVAATGGLLCAFGLAVFAWKALLLELPVRPSPGAVGEGVWQVQLQITVRGLGDDASVRAAIPVSDARQRVFGERFTSDRLSLAIREGAEGRTAVWRGWMEDTRRVLYDFQVQLFERDTTIPPPPHPEPGPTLRAEYVRPSAGVPSSAGEIRALLGEIGLPERADTGGRIRTIFAFVMHEIEAGESAGDDAILTLAQRSGSEKGRERLLVTLLRGCGIPARLVQGLELRDGTARRRLWTEAWVGGRWVPMSATAGFFERIPPDTLALRRDDGPIVEGVGVRAEGHVFTALRESLSREELAAVMVPPDPILRRVSLYRLSVPMQSALRVLLLLPIAALVVAILRNVAGVPSYGTFMPMLIALSLREVRLDFGLFLVGLVLVSGILVRLFVERLRLLLVPRLSLLLCVVVLAVTVLGLAGRDLDDADFYAGILFPIVILTMLIERITIVIAEEGTREAVVRGLWSLLLAAAAYPIFRSDALEHLMFGFPELVFVVMGVLVFVGGYSGYRVTDLIRFRRLASRAEGVP